MSSTAAVPDCDINSTGEIINRLKDKVAVITGGNSGIGLATAKAFIEQGARVVRFGRDQKSLDNAVETLGNKAFAVRGDVTIDADLESLFATAQQQFGKVDVLFANAGVAEFAPIDQVTDSHFDKLFDINVKGLLKTVQHSVATLNDNASIILTTSVSNEAGMPGMSVYAASKAAARSFARTFSAELVDRGIRVNAVSPGPIGTPIYARARLAPEDIDKMGEQMSAQVPLKRFGEPRDRRRRRFPRLQ